MNLRSDKQVKIQALLFDLSNDPWIEHNITLFFPKKISLISTILGISTPFIKFYYYIEN